MVHLISANVLYLASVLELFTNTFVTLSVTLLSLSQKNPLTFGDDKRFLEEIHTTIGRIFAIVPTAGSLFYPMLYKALPHKRFASQKHLDFMQQLLHLTTYQPLATMRMVDMVMERCLEIDVDIVIEDSGKPPCAVLVCCACVLLHVRGAVCQWCVFWCVVGC